jgi:hypothetical protein
LRDQVQEIAGLLEEETDVQVWKRALAEVHAYWRPKLDEDDHDGWQMTR